MRARYDSREVSTPSGESNYARIYNVIRRIPRGRVATYGQIADLAGLPGHARQVGYALAATPGDLSIPWHRVINARGEVAARSDPFDRVEDRQRRLLEEEGVAFDARGRVSLNRFQWREETSKRRNAKTPKPE